MAVDGLPMLIEAAVQLNVFPDVSGRRGNLAGRL